MSLCLLVLPLNDALPGAHGWSRLLSFRRAQVQHRDKSAV